MGKQVRSLIPGKSSSNNVRLICFPCAGGGRSAFAGLTDSLGLDIEVVRVELPGHGSRLDEEPLDSLSSIVDHIVPELLSDAGQSLIFFGHSMGCLVAYEVAHRLRALEATVPLGIIAAARAAPNLKDPGRDVHNLPYEDFLEELRLYDGTPPEVVESREIMQLLLPTLRADFKACETYHCPRRSLLEIPVLAYAGIDDPQTTVATILEWQKHTLAGFRFRLFEGGHFFVEASNESFVAALRRDVAALMTGIGPRFTTVNCGSVAGIQSPEEAIVSL
jgi:surfactin synthase thioesterase subunit